jgi:hypothetical protein
MSRLEPSHLFLPGEVQRPSGLWTPVDLPPAQPPPEIPEGMLLVVGQPPSDLDAFAVAPCAEDLGIDPLTLDQVNELISGLPFEPAMMALAVFSAGAWFAGADSAKHLALAEEVFGTGRPIIKKLREFSAAGPKHLLINEQHLAVLMRLLITGASSDADGLRQLEDEEIDKLLGAVVAIADPINAGNDRATERGSPATWAPYTVRAGLYFDQSNLGNDHGRARALFVDLFGVVDPESHRWCDLAAWMEEDIVGFADQMAFAYAMGSWAKALDGDISLGDRMVAVKREGLLENQLPAEATKRLAGAISADRAELVERFAEAGDSFDHLVWDRAPFEQRPFLRLRDGRMILMNPRFLHAWMGEGFYYRLLDSAAARSLSDRPGQSMSRRFTAFHGELMERYVLHLTEDSHRHQRRAGLATVAGERLYTGADGSESRSPDVTVAYGPELVAIEVSGGRPARRARILSDPAAMQEAIDRVVAKLGELDRAIGDILAGRVEIDGVDLEMLERIWPVVVVPATILQSEMLWHNIEAQAPGLFTQPLMKPPTLFSIEDYEHTLGIVELGQGLPSLLGGRLDSIYRTMPPSHFFAAQHFNPDRPRYLDQQMRQAGDEASRRLFQNADQSTE